MIKPYEYSTERQRQAMLLHTRQNLKEDLQEAKNKVELCEELLKQNSIMMMAKTPTK